MKCPACEGKKYKIISIMGKGCYKELWIDCQVCLGTGKTKKEIIDMRKKSK